MARLKYELTAKDYYIECSLDGDFTSQDADILSRDILSFSRKTRIRRILFDVTNVNLFTIHRVIRSGLDHLQKISREMDAIASYVPETKMFALANFFSLILNIPNRRVFKRKEDAITFLNHFISLTSATPAHEAFRYHLSIQGNYILCRVSGVPNKEGIILVSDELIALVKKSGIKKLFLDASGLKPFYSTLGQGIKYFKIITGKIERGASFIPDRKIYALGRFIELVSGVRNWKTFNKKTEAFNWLMKNPADSSAMR